MCTKPEFRTWRRRGICLPKQSRDEIEPTPVVVLNDAFEFEKSFGLHIERCLLVEIGLALKRQTGRGRFAEQAGLIGSGERHDFVKHTAAHFIDIPTAQERIDLVAGGF